MTTAVLSPKSTSRAMMTLGDQQVAVRLTNGFITRVARKVRLFLGTDLYIAKDTGPNSKVSPYQPGYMKLVAGAGGLLGCPPTTRDPITGEVCANPRVEYYGNTGVVRSVTATAVCVVRNPATGAPIPSRATIMLDCEHIFRQALLKLGTRDDAVRYMTREDYEEGKRGELKGWAFLDMGPIGAAYNMRVPAVMEAYQTFINQGATARQRTMSKAERLACDHNAGTRMTWEKGMLTPHPDGGPSFVDVSVVAWVEERDAAAMEAFMADVASSLNDGVESVYELDEGDEEIDEDVDPADAAAARAQAYRALPDHGEPAPLVEQPKEKVLVKPEPTIADPKKKAAADPLAEVAALEAKVSPPEMLGALRAEAGIKGALTSATSEQLAAYVTALRAEVS